MSDSHDSRYREARRHFDELEIEERSRFLIEATASTLADGVMRAGEVLADGIEETLRQARGASGRSSDRRQPGAAEPETAQRRRSRSGTGAPDARS